MSIPQIVYYKSYSQKLAKYKSRLHKTDMIMIRSIASVAVVFSLVTCHALMMPIGLRKIIIR